LSVNCSWARSVFFSAQPQALHPATERGDADFRASRLGKSEPVFLERTVVLLGNGFAKPSIFGGTQFGSWTTGVRLGLDATFLAMHPAPEMEN
jgi:hypothetical protein